MIKFKHKETAHGISLRSLWMMLYLFVLGTGSALADDYVAQIGVRQYTDLTEAFYDAAAGETVFLLQDVDISVTSGNDQFCAEIPNGIIFDGNGHKVTVNRRGISVAPQSSNSRAFFAAKAAPSTYTFNVTIKNITIENTASQSRGYGGRCITTRGKLGSLTLDNVTLTTDGSTYNNTLSPLFIGGNQATAPAINIQNNSSIIADASAAKGNAITTVNPIVLNVTGSTLTAATAINFGEADESAGSNGSEVTIATSTINSAAAAFHFYDNDIAVNVEASTINAGAGVVATFGTTTGNTVRLASAGNVVSYTTLTDAADSESFSVSKGTFNHVVPNAYLADEFDVTASLAGQETLTTPLRLTSGSKMTIASGSIKGDVVADGGTLVFGTTDTNDITVTGNQSLNLNTGNFVNDIAEQYLAEHFATNLISDVYVVKPTIQIATVADLQELATLVNTPNGAATSGNTYELTVDLDMTGVNWTPIGNLAAYPSRSFQGTFDGKGHTIGNLTCVDNTVNYATAALFGSTKNGIIKNLTLSNVDIQSKHYAAAFVAYTSEGTNTVENCHVVGGSIVSTPELINGSYDNGDKVGGIVGYTTNFNIINCSVENVTLQAYRDLGGLAGYVSGGTVEGNTVKDVTLTQDNTNGYKKNADGSLSDQSTTVGMVVGGRSGSAVKEQASDATKNTTDNVVITDPVVIAKIGAATFATLEAAVATATEGQTVEICKAGTYTMPSLPQNITIKGAVSGVVFNCEGSGNIAAVPNGATFENVTMKFGTNDYHGFQNSGEITMKDCTLNGKLFNYNNMVFDGCTFNAPGTEESGYSNKEYSMWVYCGNVTYTNCTFNSAGKVVNVYNDQVYTTPFSVTATNCTFNSTVANKAAFNVKATCGSTALLYEVTVEDCETETPANWPAASESSSLVVVNQFVQVDDINPVVPSVTDITQITTDPLTGEKTEEVLYTTRVAEYNGTRYDTFQEAIDAAEAADEENIVINLLNDATLDITAWDGTKNPLSIGTVNTQTITINGNSHTLNFNKKDSDWNNVATMNDAQTKLILNDMTLTDSGYNNGPWNRYDINFNCNVELNNVTSTKALAFKNDATLNNVTVEDNNDVYGIWIQTKGQNVTMNNVTVNVPNGRGIAIKDEYVDAAPAEPTALEAKEVTFTTAKKAAILVTSQYGAEIKASDLDITNVAADSENAVWVDEDRANVYGEVTLTGDATMIPEGGVEAYTVVRKTGDKVEGYYTDLAKALSEAEANQTIELKADFELNTTANSAETAVSIVANNHKVILAEDVSVYTKENTYSNVFTTADLNVSSIKVSEEESEEDKVYAYEATAIFYAQIGNNTYRSLQAALDDVAKAYDSPTEVTVHINRDLVEQTVTVKEYKNFKVTIDGAKAGESGCYTFGGQMILDGMRVSGGSVTNGASITLQNIAFVQDVEKDAITSPSNSYTHHVTIQNCTYEGNAEWTGTWFVNMLDVAYYFNINNITVKNTRLLSGKGYNTYAESGIGLIADNVTATEGISAVFNNVKTNSKIIISNSTIAATKYVLRDAPEAYDGTITLRGNDFTTTTTESDEGVIYTRRPADTKPHILVESGSYKGRIAQKDVNHVIAISGGHFNANLTDAAYADFIADEYVAINDETESVPYTVQHAIAKRVVSEKNVYYLTVNDAVTAAEDGDVITLLTSAAEEGTINGADVAVASGKNVTLDLNGVNYAADNITVTGAATITNGTVTAAITNSGELTVTGATNVNGNIASTGTTTFDSNYTGTFTGAIAATAGTVSIAAGTFNMSFDGLDAAYYNISGGKFSSIVPAAFCAEGYVCETTPSENLYNVVAGTNVAMISTTGYQTLDAAFKAAQDNETVTMISDVALSEPLNIEAFGKKITLDLNEKTLSGRTNLKGGELTIQNGTVAGGAAQALNVYGSDDATATNYSVLNIADDVTVTADAFGVVLFGKTAGGNGYGAVINIAGTVNTTGTGSEGSVFVSGNLGKNVSGDMNNVINITGSVSSQTDAAVALNGNATVNISENAVVEGNTAIAIKRGTLNVTGGTITATGEKNYPGTANYNGTEMTGAAVSMSSTYNQYGAMAVNISGGTFVSNKADALYKAEGNYANDATFAVSGGEFSSILLAEFCADGYICETTASEGLYKVVEGANVAVVDGIGYTTFTEAFGAVMVTGSTLQLLKDTEMTGNVSATKSFTLNFDSNELTQGDYAITLAIGVTVTTDEQIEDYEKLFIPADNTYMVVEDGYYTYSLVTKESEGIYELADGTAFPYNLTSDVQADKVTYTRSYDENRVDKYQGWMLPFDYTITAEDLENFSFFKISMVAHSNVAGESASTEDIWIHVNPMSVGEVLRANKPYIYKPKTAIDNYEFISENVILKKPMETMLLQTATSEATYSFFGTYQTTTLAPSTDHRDFYLSISGDLSYPSSGNIAVGAYRWYLRMESKNMEYARGIGFVIEDDNTTTNLRNISITEDGDIFYTLDGVRVEKPVKGIFIKKSADGKSQKVSFK
ncbi:MAG: hypothetical protein IJ546_07955 [Prevotella sp.]|nr:hypothetical protein [Prevotella sp.]